MTEDLLISLATNEKTTKLTPTEQVERAYKDVRDTTVEEFSGHDDYGFGGDDFGWG